jgi:hypothetical protein
MPLDIFTASYNAIFKDLLFALQVERMSFTPALALVALLKVCAYSVLVCRSSTLSNSQKRVDDLFLYCGTLDLAKILKNSILGYLHLRRSNSCHWVTSQYHIYIHV